MVELLVGVHDSANATDIYMDVKLPRRGDVHCIERDGHVWGGGELTAPHLRIFQMPGFTRSNVSHLLEGEFSTGPNPMGPLRSAAPMLQYRGSCLDLAALVAWHETAVASGRLARFVADDNRAAPAFLIELSQAVLAGLVKLRPARLDPNVIGFSTPFAG